MAECFTVVKERKRIAINVIYEIDKAIKINKENSQLLNWNYIKNLKKINMSFQKTNGDIAFYEAKITITAAEQIKLEFEGYPTKKKSHKLLNKAQFFESVKKGIIRNTINGKWWEILKIPKLIKQMNNTPETEQKRKKPEKELKQASIKKENRTIQTSVGLVSKLSYNTTTQTSIKLTATTSNSTITPKTTPTKKNMITPTKIDNKEATIKDMTVKDDPNGKLKEKGKKQTSPKKLTNAIVIETKIHDLIANIAPTSETIDKLKRSLLLKEHPVNSKENKENSSKTLWKTTDKCSSAGCTARTSTICPFKLCKRHCSAIKNNCSIEHHRCQKRSNIENFRELWSTLVEISKAIKHNNVLVQKYRNELEDDTVATEKINSTIQLAAETATISLKTAKKTERHDLLIKSLQDEIQETKIDIGIIQIKQRKQIEEQQKNDPESQIQDHSVIQKIMTNVKIGKQKKENNKSTASAQQTTQTPTTLTTPRTNSHPFTSSSSSAATTLSTSSTSSPSRSSLLPSNSTASPSTQSNQKPFTISTTTTAKTKNAIQLSINNPAIAQAKIRTTSTTTLTTSRTATSSSSPTTSSSTPCLEKNKHNQNVEKSATNSITREQQQRKDKSTEKAQKEHQITKEKLKENNGEGSQTNATTGKGTALHKFLSDVYYDLNINMNIITLPPKKIHVLKVRKGKGRGKLILLKKSLIPTIFYICIIYIEAEIGQVLSGFSRRRLLRRSYYNWSFRTFTTHYHY